MRRFTTAAGWAALAAGCLLASAVALAAPEGETQKTESQKGI